MSRSSFQGFFLRVLKYYGFVKARQNERTAILAMVSSILNREVKYNIYLPPGYADTNQHYPVVYLLHGNGDDHTAWINKGRVNTILDTAFTANEIIPFIIALPDAGTTYYVNDLAGNVRYEDMFMQEFMPFIEKEYRIKREKKYRSIAGLSMGGYGSLLYALKYPDLFNTCVALSAAIRSDTEIMNLPQSEYDRRFKHISGIGKKGRDRLTPSYRQHSILDLVNTIPPADLKKVNYYLDCGEDDHLTQGNAMFHLELIKLNVPHEYRSRNGGHDWEYWQSGILAGFKFITENLK